MEKTNSASRILHLLRQAHAHQDTKKVHEVWSSVFEINESNQNKRNIEITRCLSLMHDEIESIIEEMNFSSRDEFNCKSLLLSMFGIIAVHALMGQWAGLKQVMTNESFLCLGYCREVLPDEETLINSKDIEEIVKLISTLEEQLKNSKLPVFTRKIIQKHIVGIREGLHSYKIMGAESLQNAMNSVIGEVVANRELFESSEKCEEISTLRKIIKKVLHVTDSVVKTEKVLTSGVKVGEYGAKAIELMNDIL